MLNICNCETCEFNKHVEQLIELVGDSVIRKQLREAFDTLNGKIVHLNMDYEWLTAIVENTWPSAEEQMNNWGWVRKREEVEPKPARFKVKSVLMSGEIVYEGNATLVRWTNTGGVFVCDDGIEREVKTKDDRYGNDYIWRHDDY